MRLLVLAALISTGCATALGGLPKPDQKAWLDCYQVVRGRNCPQPGVHGDVCMRALADQYAEADAARRPGLLTGLGCPAELR